MNRDLSPGQIRQAPEIRKDPDEQLNRVGQGTIGGDLCVHVTFTDQSTGNPAFLYQKFGNKINAAYPNPLHTNSLLNWRSYRKNGASRYHSSFMPQRIDRV